MFENQRMIYLTAITFIVIMTWIGIFGIAGGIAAYGFVQAMQKVSAEGHGYLKTLSLALTDAKEFFILSLLLSIVLDVIVF